MCFTAFRSTFRNTKKCLFLSGDLLILQPLRKRSLRVKEACNRGLKKLLKKVGKDLETKYKVLLLQPLRKRSTRVKKRPLKSLEKTFKKSVTKFGKQNQSYTFALASKEGQMIEKSVRLKREKNFKYF